MNRLLTTDEVADLLNVKPSTIRKWVHLEQIPVVRLGRAVRFQVDIPDADSVNRFRRRM